MKRLIIRSVAETDIAEAAGWYDRERGADFAARFLAALDTTFGQIEQQPFLFAPVESETRRAPVAGFPYGVFYVVGFDAISVIAILHASRDPTAWQRRG